MKEKVMKMNYEKEINMMHYNPPKLNLKKYRNPGSWFYQLIFILIVVASVFTIDLGIEWYDRFKIVKSGAIVRFYISACSNGFEGDLDQYIKYFYGLSFQDAGLISGIFSIALLVLIDLSEEFLKLISFLEDKIICFIRTKFEKKKLPARLSQLRSENEH